MLRTVFSLLLLVPAVASAEEVAEVLVLQGEVQLVDVEGTHVAEVGERLDRDDVLVVAEESAAVLQLHNDYLVRLDEDLEIAVGDLVLLDAPATTRSAAEQLAELLYPDERETMDGLDRAERVAGWHARVSAGASAPPSLAARVRAGSAATGAGGGGLAESAEEVDEETTYDFESDAIEGELVASEGEVLVAREACDTDDDAFALGSEEAEDIAQRLLSRKAERCVDRWTGDLPVALDQVLVVVRSEDGVVVGVVLPEAGLRPPRCLERLVVGRDLPQPELRIHLAP